MNRRVTFKTLWLVSERERTARKQPLHQKTLLLGSNGTGKSRIVKNLYWVFGCAPTKHQAGSWDPDTVVGLEFSYANEEYLVVRQGKRLGLFDGAGKLLKASGNMRDWDSFIGSFFGYRLQFQRPNSSAFHQAGMDYLTLPFYVDQDGSWGPQWDTYTTLGQFSQWRPAAFEAFIGLRPNAYFAAKQKKDEASVRAKDKRKELEVQREAFTRVREVLPKHVPSLDLTSFRAELTELGNKALKVQNQQVNLRGRLLAAVNLREKLQSELLLARAAQNELLSDLTYLSEIPTTNLECPTCGTVHENSFHGRMQLAQDSDAMAVLIAELGNKFSDAKDEEASVRGELQRMEKSLGEIHELMQAKKARLKLEDVLTAHSKKTINIAFQRVTSDLSASLSELEEQLEKLSGELKVFEDKERLKTVGEYFEGQLTSISNSLNIPSDEQLKAPKPGNRTKAGGSPGPRSVLAMHLAMMLTNVEYGDTPLFPFIADTPQQNGQDDKNLLSMVTLIGQLAGANHQVILAAEKLPEGTQTSEFEVVQFLDKKGALKKEWFDEVAKRLSGPLSILKAAITERKLIEA